jgi:hypothetical protein
MLMLQSCYRTTDTTTATTNYRLQHLEMAALLLGSEEDGGFSTDPSIAPPAPAHYHLKLGKQSLQLCLSTVYQLFCVHTHLTVLTEFQQQ